MCFIWYLNSWLFTFPSLDVLHSPLLQEMGRMVLTHQTHTQCIHATNQHSFLMHLAYPAKCVRHFNTVSSGVWPPPFLFLPRHPFYWKFSKPTLKFCPIDHDFRCHHHSFHDPSAQPCGKIAWGSRRQTLTLSGPMPYPIRHKNPLALANAVPRTAYPAVTHPNSLLPSMMLLW